jgi:predicted RNA-binding Zn-ribbon protein involved in translation (DUF1610 family)
MALGISEAIELTRQISELVKKGITIDLQERIMQLREAVLNVKDEVLRLREENQGLRSNAQAAAEWTTRILKYEFVTAPGGALVWRSTGPPEHYACPTCIEGQHIHPLQPTKYSSSTYTCQNCKAQFNVMPKPPRAPAMSRGGWR